MWCRNFLSVGYIFSLPIVKLENIDRQASKDKQIEGENEFEEDKSGNKNAVSYKNTNGAEAMEVDGAGGGGGGSKNGVAES